MSVVYSLNLRVPTYNKPRLKPFYGAVLIHLNLIYPSTLSYLMGLRYLTPRYLLPRVMLEQVLDLDVH